jgi:hypothetical protein
MTTPVRLRRGGYNIEKAGSVNMNWFIRLVLALTGRPKGSACDCCDECDICVDCP